MGLSGLRKQCETLLRMLPIQSHTQGHVSVELEQKSTFTQQGPSNKNGFGHLVPRSFRIGTPVSHVYAISSLKPRSPRQP